MHVFFSVPIIAHVSLTVSHCAHCAATQFAMDHFRPPSKKSMKATLGRKKGKQSLNTWVFSRDPIKAALLKKIAANEDLNNKAVQINQV